MRLVVVGAAGRMGCGLIRALLLSPGATVLGAVDGVGNPGVGQDAGALVGLPATGITVTSDPLKAFADAEGVLDFTSPSATVEFAGLAAQARIVHVIGTTGLAEGDIKKLDAAARH